MFKLFFFKENDQLFETWVNFDEDLGHFEEELTELRNKEIRDVYNLYLSVLEKQDDYDLNEKKSPIVYFLITGF